MRRRDLLALGLSALPSVATAQSGERPKVLAAISPSATSPRDRLQIFWDALRGLGWVREKNLRLRTWFLKRTEQFAAAAAEAVAESPDLIVTISTAATLPTLHATRSIPVLFLLVTDPLGQRLVASLNDPGGNVTGFTDFEPSLGSKWLGTLQSMDPKLRHVLTIFDPSTSAGPRRVLPSLAAAAKERGLTLTVRMVHGMRDVAAAVSAFAQEPNGGLIVPPDVYLTTHEREVIALAARYRLPAAYGFAHWVENGGLLSYGPDLDEIYRHAAVYADRILRGTKPADLPVQNPTKWQLGINLKTARSLGLTVPQSLLLAADEVVR